MAHYWMAYQIEWFAKLTGSFEWLMDIKWPTEYWVPRRTRGAWCILGANLSQARFFLKYGYDKVFWVAPSLEYRRVLVYPRNQNTSVFGIPFGHKDRSK